MSSSPTSLRGAISEALCKLWWIPLVRGIILVILGGYALFTPGMSAVALTQTVGVFIIADGVLSILAAILGNTPSRAWSLVRGALAVFSGAFIFAHPVLVAGVTTSIVMYLIAGSVIAGGVLEIAGAIRDRREIEGEGWLILGGGLAVLFGVLLLVAPLAFGLVIIQVLGAYAIVFGVSLVFLAFRIRKFGKSLGRS